MNYEETFRKMRVMRMLGMHEAFKLSLETKHHQQLASDELIHFLIEAEYEDRQNRKIHRYLKAARFRYQSSIEEVDFTSSCQFLEKQENIIITGPTGVGKSYLASAMGHQACMKGYKVLYYNTTKLFTQLKMSRADGSYVKLINRLERQDLLILDDFGLHPLDEENQLMLLEVIEDRHGRQSTIVTSQLPVIKWYELFQAQTCRCGLRQNCAYCSSYRAQG